VSYLVLFFLLPRWRRHEALRRLTLLHWSGLALLALAALAAFLIANRTPYLPSGSPQFRLLTYERAWHRFLASPLWGTLFTAPGAEKFRGFDTGVSNNILPTHSDVLDLLANGGVLAIALWLWGLARVMRLAWRALHRPLAATDPLTPYAHALACMSVAGVLTYAFNPILLQPDKALLLWANLGFLTGAARLIGTGRSIPSTTP
jgi:O-antigen ligase